MDLTDEEIRDLCPDAVFERGRTYLEEGRIERISRFDDELTAVVAGSRRYDVRVDPSSPESARCSCPYDGPGTCKHVVAVLLRWMANPPTDERDRIDAVLERADPDALRAFLREELASDVGLRDRFLARFDGSTTRSVAEFRAEIDRLFEETNPDYAVVFDPIDFDEYLELAASHREQGRYDSAAAVHRALIESLDDHMELVDGSYDHFTRAFTTALDGYVDCVAASDGEPAADEDATADGDIEDAAAFLEDRAASGTPFLANRFERAAAELRDRAE
ncbi:SWIM zinc finger family protein [Halopenitus persicus]|uniref:SWIM zinc finger family protein n=1 Tax=Halopenitus persicus TaxID=1048396 RepID=UPI000BBA5D59|nr:SWIM zinc finger family protein [Halopenitus persicus]